MCLDMSVCLLNENSYSAWLACMEHATEIQEQNGSEKKLNSTVSVAKAVLTRGRYIHMQTVKPFILEYIAYFAAKMLYTCCF